MERINVVRFALVFSLACGFCMQARPQSTRGVPETALKTREVNPVPAAAPFSPEASAPGRVNAIEFRTPAEMTEKDREVEAGGESSIRERARFEDLGFNEGAWSYQQLVCPALPNHVFLRFLRNNGAGDVSMFTVSIPRGGDGRVRIIPILKRGYSLFSPAPINKLTISAFNHIRDEEHAAQTPDWLTTGLCYAALAGARPREAVVSGEEKVSDFPVVAPSTLRLPSRGGADIRFVDIAAPRRPMEWTMSFDAKGRLLKAAHLPASLVTAKKQPDLPGDPRSSAAR